MDKTTMIVLLVICGIVLILAVIAVIPRIKNALAGVPIIVYIVIIVAMIALMAVLAIKAFGPKGTDSLSSDQVEGTEQGDAVVDTDLSGTDGTGTHFNVEEILSGNEIGDNTIYIRIRGDQIKIGAAPVDSIEDFTAAMESLACEGNPVCLVDDYATSRTYKAARSALDGLGIIYTEHAE